METQSFEIHDTFHEKTIKYVASLFRRLQNKNVDKKRFIMKDGDFNRLFRGNDMEKYRNRLRTYIDQEWTKDVSVSDLSSAGFCFTGEEDKVVCFSCKGVLSSWEIGNMPIVRHIKAFPYCKIARDIVKKSKSKDSKLSFDHARVTIPADYNDDRELEYGIRSISFFNSEYNRLVSFPGWPINHPVGVLELAKAGFYHTEDSSDSVKCFACFATIKDWKGDEQPMVKHRQVSPNCPFMKGLRSDNKNLTKDELNQVKKLFRRFKMQSHLTIPVQCTESHLESDSDVDNDESQTNAKTPIKSKSEEESYRDYPMYLTCQHKEYYKEHERLESFSNWPKDHFLQPTVLVRAGFFKSGKDDQVTCFYCDLNLLGWEQDDDPLEEHTRERSNCRWLEFAKTVIRVEEMKEKQYNADATSVDSGKEDTVTFTEQHDVEKEVDQLAKSEMTKDVFDLGFNEEIVKHVIRQRIERGQTPFQNTGELMEAIFKEEEDREHNKKSKSLVSENASFKSGTPKNNGYNKQAMDDLEEKIDKLEERNTCKICLDDEVMIIFFPCKHLAVCEDCSEKVESCPICREYIDDKIQVFIP